MINVLMHKLIRHITEKGKEATKREGEKTYSCSETSFCKNECTGFQSLQNLSDL